MSEFFDIPYYHSYLSPKLAKELLKHSSSVEGVQGLQQIGESGGLENKDSLNFLTQLYETIKDDLNLILQQRTIDRKFIDERMQACSEFNVKLKRDNLDPSYKTMIGMEDAKGRIVIGPKSEKYNQRGGNPVADLPDFLKGPHVTLFGPPDSAKLAINAMNSYHRKLKNEPPIVEQLLKSQKSVPIWGADEEDSKTPLRKDLMDAAINLTSCFEQNIQIEDGNKKYQLEKDHLSLPIKRFPGLALPATFLFYKNNPLPLHLYDFALHLFRSWQNPQALVFYVPKLENEEEAAYIHKMIFSAETLIKKIHANYVLGSVRVMVVLENPRAILRTHEIMDELYPYFAGASLGWHDYLGSTARLFKEDGHYQIPVKADPDIVIKYIKASHLLIGDVVGSRGGIKVGGMYGILPQDYDLDSPSFQISLLGFIKDVVTQMKRDLTGFWVAHPDFVRLGLSLVEAWRLYKMGQEKPLEKLAKELLAEKYHEEIINFIHAEDIEGLDASDPNYVRSLIVADIKKSDFIPNNHPNEIRYNVFQSLQYLTDWLCGNGCVALPTVIRGVAVRVMDDLATAERSRWEVWHELYHGRFNKEDFIRIVHEEMNFIRKDLSNENKIVQVKWDEKSSKWYPIALQIMLQLMTDPNPVEFATELLMPFTIDYIRKSPDPWVAVKAIDADKYKLNSKIEKMNYYFAACGCQRFAEAMAKNAFLDFSKAEDLIQSFTLAEVLEAASFHGDIGEMRKSLDLQATKEQMGVLQDSEFIRLELISLGKEYLKKFGFKFLISAKEKSGSEIFSQLKLRLLRTAEAEISEAKKALWEITYKRLNENPIDNVQFKINELLNKYNVVGASLAVNCDDNRQVLSFGYSKKDNKDKSKVTQSTRFQIASLSKTLATAFCIEYFLQKNISLETSVNELFQKTPSSFRLENNQVQLKHLMNHTALNMHYVKGFPLDQKLPSTAELLLQPDKYGYEAVKILNSPGQKFSYSGGGFLVLEHLIESLEQKPILEISQFKGFSKLNKSSINDDVAKGYFDNGDEVTGGHLQFPLFAAGVIGTTNEMAEFLENLTNAYHLLKGSKGISHDTAVNMLFATDLGSKDFIGANVGLGTFVIEAGDNKLALHQGANEGFRALYVQCFSGPDCGKGFVIYTNGDNAAIGFIAEVAQEVLKNLNISGIDFNRFQTNFEFSNLGQEQIVNRGFSDLIFSAFNPCRPPPILTRGTLSPMAKYNLLAGAIIYFVSDERFARAENLLSSYEPLFDPELFCSQGKVMDSWESSRHNVYSFHLLELNLNKPSKINYVCLSTQFHDGNQAEFVQIMARSQKGSDWIEILEKTKLSGHSEIKIKLDPNQKSIEEVYTQIQVRVYPDGGLTRLGLYSELPTDIAQEFQNLSQAHSVRFSDNIPRSKRPLSIAYSPTELECKLNLQFQDQPIDSANAAFGGHVVKVSNEHYGPAEQVISPFPPIHMFDGFESARSRNPQHHEELVLKLFAPTKIESLIFDFTYFVNNNPRYLSILGFHDNSWEELVVKAYIKNFAANKKEFRIQSNKKYNQIMLRVYPDGGINRIHVLGFTD